MVECMFDDENVALAGLATMAPGPRLAVVLASIDRSRLEGFEQVAVMEAWARQAAYCDAELRTSVAQVATTATIAGGTADGELNEFASDEVAAALTYTRYTADAEVELSWALTRRFPQVLAALRAGRIDLRKARVIVTKLRHVDDAVARRVVDAVLVWAPGWTTGELGSSINRRVITADPGGAADRTRKAQRRRRVIAAPETDGTASIYASGLPVERVAAAMDNVDALARAAKTPGDDRDIDQRRADVLLDLLEGRIEPARRGVVDIRVDLATLVGISEAPGEIPGWGPVAADIARQIAAAHVRGQWRAAVTDPDTGDVIWDGTTRRRPTTRQRRHIQARIPRCIFPGCRRPAINCDLDHRQRWTDGGPTAIDNLAPLCRHHHRSKDEAGWRLERRDPGTYRWTSPLGHKNVVQPNAP
jgi:hypothetical protein